ncbi:hypothetical protein ABZ714_18510 [Streptomyces sp. NPDC006798]|uniref:hypothetical protein n=1 Tax=Streptomyces sp. NPDC006798 TaxID=3155462 RepID=UPI003404A597
MSGPGDHRPAGEILYDEERPVPPSAAPVSRWRIRPVSLALALMAGVAAWAAFGDELSDRGRDRALESACEGLAPAPEVRAVLGPGPLAEDREHRIAEGGGDPANPLHLRCVLVRTGGGAGEHLGRAGSVDIGVRSVPAAGTEAARRAAPDYSGASASDPVPLGHGWYGFLDDSFHQDGKVAAVLLDCATDLLVTAETAIEGGGTDDPAERVALARLVTAVATGAGERYGCGMPSGATVPRTVPLPPADDEAVPPAAARGACSGVRPGFPGARVADGGGHGLSPREYCRVVGTPGAEQFGGSPRGRGGYTLEAFYGPYAAREPDRAESVVVRNTACGLYVLRGGSADPGARRALDTFARASALKRGCAFSDPGPAEVG